MSKNLLSSANSPLNPQTWPFAPECLPPNTYLVGGSVRDALLGRTRDYLDLDFVTPHNSVATAQKIAQKYQAGFVLLDAQRQIARVVFKEATADFAQQEGQDLATDLHRRDFTINAIAYNPSSGEIIDPLQGCQDLQAGVLRMISAKNLEDDPLRLLRAYRQAGQLGFCIEPVTRQAIRQRATLLKTIAAERVRGELAYLLAIPQGKELLKAACLDQLLQQWFIDLSETNISLLKEVEEAAAELSTKYPPFTSYLQQNLRPTLPLSLIAVAKLLCLVGFSPLAAEKTLLNLKYSRAEIQTSSATLRYLPTLQSRDNLSIREQYFLFKDLGPAFPVLATVALASAASKELIEELVSRFINKGDAVAHPSPLLTGHDLISHLNIPPSPQLGQLLTEINIAVAEGTLKTRSQALEFARNIWQQNFKNKEREV